MFSPSLPCLRLIFGLLIFAAFHAASQEAQPSPITSCVKEAFEYGRKHARIPLRATLENNTSKDQTATLQFKDGWRDDSSLHTYSFPLPAGEQIRTVVYPVLSNNSWYEVKGERSIMTLSMNTDPRDIYAVIQKTTPVEWNLLKDGAYDAGVSSCDLMDWPADSRVYESQTCIIMPEKTYQSHLDEPHRKAIRQWVLGGGNLWLIGEKNQSVTTRILGDGRILNIPSLTGLPEKEQKARIEELVKLHSDEGGFPDFISPTDSYFYSTPSVALGLVLILFAVLVGPVSLFLWAPVGKRQRLFILIPAISVGFFILLALCILIGEGTGGTGYREVRILVNPQDHSGLITQHQICKTSVLSGHSFNIPENAGITGYNLSTKHSTILSKDLEKMTRQGEQCGGNWFTSRSTLEHRLSMPVSTRAALTVMETLPDAPPILQSTFPAPLYRLVYRDTAGKYWKINHLPPGQKTKAEPLSTPEEWAETAPGHFQAGMEEVQGDLGPIPTLPSIKWEKTNITVCGPVSVTPQLHE